VRSAIAIAIVASAAASACWFDESLREYLDAHFWLPFSRSGRHFEKRNVHRVSAPFAGMAKGSGNSPLEKLRAAYQSVAWAGGQSGDAAALKQALEGARSDASLTAREREEVRLIDAKIEMRTADDDARSAAAKTKIEQFLRTARTPEFLSEARGWLAHVYYESGNQTAAGKIYLDELNRNGSNLSRETLLTSLRMNYGYDGGQELRDHIEEYFDTPEHAAFAIEISTNPRWPRENPPPRGPSHNRRDPRLYARIHQALEKHRSLLETARGAHALALLSMRTSLAMGDPPGAVSVASAVRPDDPLRAEPDFQWMLASAYFLSREYAASENPLLDLFNSRAASPDYKAAAAYGLCGVYEKSANVVEQLHYAMWLRTKQGASGEYGGTLSQIDDLSVYWAPSGWDSSMLLDAEASIEDLENLVEKYPHADGVRTVKYSLAVRLSRENRYEEAARIYKEIHAVRRAPRLRQLAKLYAEAGQSHESAYRLAAFLHDHENGIYFNDALWGGLQHYALFASEDSRLTHEEQEKLSALERRLKDDQEEYWRAYLILHDVAAEEGKTELGRRAARLGMQCVRSISGRFGRLDDLRRADRELSLMLH
jgi:hypothetical protein